MLGRPSEPAALRGKESGRIREILTFTMVNQKLAVFKISVFDWKAYCRLSGVCCLQNLIGLELPNTTLDFTKMET